MPMQLSSEEWLPETAVRARKKPFVIAGAIVSHLKNIYFILLTHLIKPEVNFYDRADHWACAGN